MFPKSIKFRITLWYSLILFLTMAILGIFMGHRINRELYKGVVDKLLKHESDEYKFWAGEKGQGISTFIEYINKENEGKRRNERLFAQIVDIKGKVVAQSKSLEKYHLTIDDRMINAALKGKMEPLTMDIGGSRPFMVRVLSTALPTSNGKPLILQVAISLKKQRKIMENFFRNMAIAIPGFTLLASLGGWLLAKKAFKPINKIMDTTKRITAEDLSQRLPTSKTGDEIERLSEQLNEMIGRLESSFKETAQFASNVSHELRTPLTVMKGEMEVALQNQKDTEAYREALYSCLEEINRLTALIDDLLLLTRMDVSDGKMDARVVALSQLLRDIYEDMKILTLDKQVEFSLSPMEETYVMGNKSQLRRLFINLVDNAIKYTPPSGKVSMALQSEKGLIKVIVEDTGVGIPEEDIPRLFDRFYRVEKDGSHSLDKGSGLGLSICKKIVDLHRGSIEVHSQVNLGSQFTVFLPLFTKNPFH